MMPPRSLRLGMGFGLLIVMLGACGTDAATDRSNSSAGSPNVAGASAGAGAGGAATAGAGAFGGSTTSAGAPSGSAGSAGAVGGSANGGSAGSGGTPSTECNPASEPLKTNDGRRDAYDCVIIAVAKKWGMPDAMIVKSQIEQESSFQVLATSGDSPCGIKQGWTDAESKSFGLIQTTPACGEALTARLPDGHPNLTQDMAAPLWANSVFNPTINLDEGVKTDVDSLKELKQKYPGCTEIQYNMMAAGAFNSGTGAITGCGAYNARAQMYVTYITSHYHEFAKAAGWTDPY